uniref:Polycystin cation channel PKD1/PKD2 domain-containing protein n=1 Tax=Romanomermis culicivorax TaxID=13658 RepID=A0A915JRZ9_ROMCU
MTKGFKIVNDVFLIIGVICKFSIEYKILGSALFNLTGMLLGLGVLFVWIGVLRYLGFFSHYNILILTMKRAMPNVLRFTVCAGLVYMGFLFCGWIIMGPYHMKFRDLMTTSECLFALINGDDMFATFTTTAEENASVVWFARIYLYIFISLFIYIVLSLFISIIMDAYEIIKDKYCPVAQSSILKDFIAECDDVSTISAGQDPCGTFSCCEFCRKIISRVGKIRSAQRYEQMIDEQRRSEPTASVI